MKNLLGSIGIVAALGGGAFALSTVMPAGAQTSTQSSPPASSSGPGTQGSGRAKAAKDALDGLVANGTITQDQENAVIQALKGALSQGGKGGFAGHPRARIEGGMLKVAADKIGVTPKDLIQARRNGQSIADVANSKGVNPDDVVKAIVDAGNQRIDQAVSNGHLAQDKADALKAKLPDLASRFVNATGMPNRDHHGGNGDNSSSSSSSSDQSSDQSTSSSS
jgi:hypothetical protein